MNNALNFLNESVDPKFVPKNWNDQPNLNYVVGNQILYSIKVLKFNFCDYNDAQILLIGDITIV